MTDLRKLLIEARDAVDAIRNEHKTHGHITDASAHWLIKVKPRIDAALAEPVEPIGYIDAEQLRRWNVLKGTEYESPERCYMPFSRKPWKSEMSDCSLAVYAAPADQWRRVDDWLPHTDHPMRHYDRTCPACNPADQWRRVEDGLPPNWKIKVTGPDSDGLLWLTISNTSGRHLSFSAASGDGLLRGAILTELMRDLSALLEGE